MFFPWLDNNFWKVCPYRLWSKYTVDRSFIAELRKGYDNTQREHSFTYMHVLSPGKKINNILTNLYPFCYFVM